MKTALILGITGQTGSYLADLLLEKSYAVHGVIRRASSFNTGRIDHIYDRLTLHYGDVCDPLSIRGIVGKVRPDEVYNLAAQSHVKVSFDQPVYSFNAAADGALHVLEAVRDYRDTTGHLVRFYQASSSEMFGSSPPPQNEATTFRPQSPYACAKVAAYHLTKLYRDAYGLHASNGILFNHESPRRGETFVTRKITRAVGRIKHGLQDKLYLGNLEAMRDWGFAGDYVVAIRQMLQQPAGGDYVVASGQSHSVRDFCRMAFGAAGLDYEDFVVIDPRYFRPAEVDHLLGDTAKIHKYFDWKPTVNFGELVQMMVAADMELADREAWERQRPLSPFRAAVVDAINSSSH